MRPISIQQHAGKPGLRGTLHIVPDTVTHMQGFIGIDRMFSKGDRKIFGAGLAASARLAIVTVSKKRSIPSPRITGKRRESKLEMIPSSTGAFDAAGSPAVSGNKPQEQDLQTLEIPARRIRRTAQTSQRDKTHCGRYRTTRAVHIVSTEGFGHGKDRRRSIVEGTLKACLIDARESGVCRNPY